MKDTFFSSKLQFNTQGILQTFHQPIVMGIINTTPDSFYEGSRSTSEEAVLNQATKMISDGATILDIGGYSSRPGADDVTESEEIKRTESLIYTIRKHFPTQLISIDTFRSNVAQKALEAGASIINDITGGQADVNIMKVAAKYQAPYILMHMRGTPQNMMHKTAYNHLTNDLILYFSERIQLAKKLGVKDIIIDPGFGFSKTINQNFELLSNIEKLHLLEMPLLIGISRKSMIYKSLGISASESLNGTSILNTLALRKGAHILRVHDVKEAIEAIKLTSLIKE